MPPVDKAGDEKSGPDAKSPDKRSPEALSDYERRLKGPHGPRRASPSKREMMEDLSRARFPWEEED
jgi:hypothetical protein